MAKKDLVLGSGKLYIYEAPVDDFGELKEIPTDAAIETEAHEVGGISGGATLTYEFEMNEIKDDLGVVYYRGLSSEEVTFKSGILTWNLDNLAKLTAGGTVSEGEGKRILKIGGLGKDLTRYLLRFVHTMHSGKKVRVTLVGTASAGFELVFDPEEATVVDAEFKAVQMADGQTLVMIEQEVDVAG